MSRIKEMRNVECGMMNNESYAVFHSSFIIHHFFLVLLTLSIHVNCFPEMI